MPSDTNETTLTAEERTEFGKGAARRVRRAHKVPAVLYGHGQAPHHISLPGHQLMLALKHGGSNALLTLKMTGGEEQMALPKAIVRDPIKGTLEHLDLLIVRRGEKVTVDVPIHTTGEPKADTLITQPVGTVSLEAEATRIPTELEVEISAMDAGDNILARDVRLPHNTTLVTEGDVIVVSALAQLTAEQLEAELESSVEDVAGEPAGEGDVVPEESEGGETAAAEPGSEPAGE